jgi:hypothetical protein
VELARMGVSQSGGKLEIVLSMRNKAERTLWVRVGITDGTRDCVATYELWVHTSASHECPQLAILPDTDYPVTVTSYTDAALSQQLEARRATMRFPAAELAAMTKYLAPQFPVTLQGVWYRTDEFRPFLPYKESGDLTVYPDKLLFSYEGGSLELPIAAITMLTPDTFLERDIDWLEVKYRQAGKDGVLYLRPATLSKTSAYDIYYYISWVAYGHPTSGKKP